MTPEAPILTERRDSVLVITLNRPEQRNAVNYELAEALAAAITELDDDPSLSVGVLAGNGKGFCAGMDLKAFAAGGKRPWIDGRGFAGIVEQPPRKPLIAAIEGFAVAGGLEIALAADLIVASKDAKLGVPEVKRSLVAAGGALLRLPQRVSYGAAMRLVLTGDLISAEKASEIGLIDEVAEPGGALEAALALAAAISINGPLALVASKEVLKSVHDWDTAAFWENQATIVAPVTGSEDAREGAVSFAERRDPVWKGR